MKYLLTSDQKAFFEKNQSIEFESFLSDVECALVKVHAQVGRDNYRQNQKVHKIVTEARFADIVKELFVVKSLRIAFEEVIEFPFTLNKAKTLIEMSSITPLVGGVMIALDGEEESESSQEKESGAKEASIPKEGESKSLQPFPKTRGNAIVFSPSLVWDQEAIVHFVEERKKKKNRYLLIAYTGTRPLYIHQERDLHTHELKRLGYVFGDRLKESTHPTVGTHR